MELAAYPRKIQDILTLPKQYFIPRFQREYSWTNDQLNELWKDIIGNISQEGDTLKTKEYFIGSLMLYGSDKSKNFEIVDGQQRMVTITILFSTLSEIYKELGESKLADGAYQYVEGKTSTYDDFFRVEIETPKPFFQHRIQQRSKDSSYEPKTTEERNLLNAYNFFSKKLKASNLFNEFKVQNIDLEQKNSNYIKLLNAIREQVEQLKTIFITVSEKEEAYSIFETLNATGMNLTTVDLVKNKIFQALQSQHPTDQAREKWTSIKDNLLDREDAVEMKVFFRHFWLSKYEFTTESKIYKSFIKKIPATTNDMRRFLNSLVEASKIYKKITNPLIGDWKLQEEKEVFDSLVALRTFRVTQPRSFLMALLDQYSQGKISLKYTIKCVQAIEKFHFIFSVICQSRASGLEGKYSKFARKLREAENKSQSTRIVISLINDLRDKLPSHDTFARKMFSNLYFTNDHTKDKKIIQYIFKAWEKSLLTTSELEISKISIEHILSQSKGVEDIGRIGNLLPLSEQINSKVGNNDFESKLKCYSQSELKVVKSFVETYSSKSDWTIQDIKNRTKKIAKIFYNDICKF